MMFGTGMQSILGEHDSHCHHRAQIRQAPKAILSPQQHGHRSFVKADLAMLHVDATVVDPAYTALASRYPRTINLPIRNIRKSLISSVMLARGEP